MRISSLPLRPEDPHSERVNVAHLNARIIFPPNEWYVSQAEALLYGVQISARGRLQNPEAFHPGEDSEARTTAPGRPEMALDILKQIEQLHYGGVPSRVEINFGGDLADMSSLYADATVYAEKIRHSGAELTHLYAALSLRHKVIELKQCNVSDSRGEMDASASYDLDTGKAALQLRSTLGPAGVLRLARLPDMLDDWKFSTPPEIEVTGSGTVGGTPEGLLTGHVALGRFTVKNTDFTGAGGDFSWDGHRWYVRNGWLGNRTGTVTAKAISLPGDFRAQVHSGINPNSLRSLAGDGLRDWDFQETPSG